jgi:signal transduction histidine kinase
MRLPVRYVCVGIAVALAMGTLVGALTMQRSYRLIAAGDMAQAILLALATLMMLMNARAARGNARLFWGLFTFGCFTWFCAQFGWVYYEVFRRTDVPDPSLIDSLFFLHIVPFMAAVALRPHRRRGPALHLGSIDLALLVVWWVYLYTFIVIPWQYIEHDPALYAMSFNMLYGMQHAVLLVALGFLWFRSGGVWRHVYGHLLAASALYAVSSRVVNWAIDRHVYYTGSVYDVPLVCSMAWFVVAGVYAARLRSRAPSEPETWEGAAVWPARLAMAAILSLPLMGVWAFVDGETPAKITMFRTLLTLGAILILTFLLFLKQHLMDRELIRLLQTTRDSFSELQLLQEQLIHTEKLASLGQLVAGAAHEINNPLTAILGYADLLSAKGSLADEHRTLLSKIEQQARRTKTLVTHLLSFAKQVPAEKTMVSLGALLRNALKLREVDLAAQQIRVAIDAPEDLPNVYGDSNQLLQVCQHIINNAVDALHATPDAFLRVTAHVDGGAVVLEFADNGPGVKDPQRIFDPFYTTKPIGRGPGLGLSACFGIVQEHQGTIVCSNRPEGGATITIRLPAVETDTQNPESEPLEPVTHNASA